MRRVALTLLVALSLAGCTVATVPASTAPPAADSEATMAAMVEYVLATVTAQAPTATLTPQATATPLPTYTPTMTPVPTFTSTVAAVEAAATSAPAPTSTSTTATAAVVAATATVAVASPAAAATAAPPPAPTATQPEATESATMDELAFDYEDIFYACELRCLGDPPVWTYRTFQIKLLITNTSSDKTIDWAWGPSRWIITDGSNTRIETRTWEYGHDGEIRLGQSFTKPYLGPGESVEWTFVAASVLEHEWVAAVEWEAWGRVYRHEFSLGTMHNAYKYQAFCGLTPVDTTCGR